ncbi:MAG: D-alanyl-D-alanine carboxypeptidase [Oscillospiraceae bacterium]|nr:D-alanyl-D-alanine carboxypeptidase [Oscillospiraceae bacterium]
MKFRRFFTVFLSLILIFQFGVTTFAAQGDVGDWEVLAKAALLADPDTEEILYARNIHEKLYPASLTKIMTALLVLEAVDEEKLSMDQVLIASESAIANLPDDGSNAGIQVGEELTVEQLLHCILVVSANEACDILAEAVSGSVPAFVERMNQRAAELGCENTHFMNTNGLQSVEHYTTAWDLYLITKQARTHDVFLRICNTKYYEVPATNLSPVRKYYTTNYLISTARNADYLYKGANGVKTGSTSDAGYCLVASAGRGERALLSVVLGAERITLEDGSRQTQSFSETVRLFNYGFDGFHRLVILDTTELIDEVGVTLSQEQNTVKVHPAERVECLIPSEIAAEDIIRTVEFVSESVEAPVTKGQVLGTVTLSYGDTVYGTVDLLADEDVSASRLLVFQKDVLEFFQSITFKLGVALFAALLFWCKYHR